MKDKILQYVMGRKPIVSIGIGIFVYALLLHFAYTSAWTLIIMLSCFVYGVYALIRGIFGSQKPLYFKRVGVACVLFFTALMMGVYSDGGIQEAAKNRQQEAERLARKKAQEPYDKQAQYEEWIAWKEQQEKQELYDKQAQYEEWVAWKEQQEKQELYDKQAQYEEWVAWQEQQEQQEKQELYDKQAQYEEWIAWQRAQAEEAARAEAEEKSQYQSVSAVGMIRDYDTNAMTAKQRYLNKKIKVLRAQIVEIDVNGDLLIASPNDDDISFIQCTPSNNLKGKSVANIEKGDVVTLYGEVTSVGDVVGRRSDIGFVRGYRMKVTRIE